MVADGGLPGTNMSYGGSLASRRFETNPTGVLIMGYCEDAFELA